MALYEDIVTKMKEALKAQDQTSLLLYRGLKNSIDAAAKAGLEISDELVLQSVSTEIKRRLEAISLYQQAGATEKMNQEEAELAILQPFLPPQLSEDEIKQLISEAIAKTGASNPQDMGKVMGALKDQLVNRADMSQVAKLVQAELRA